MERNHTCMLIFPFKANTYFNNVKTYLNQRTLSPSAETIRLISVVSFELSLLLLLLLLLKLGVSFSVEMFGVETGEANVCCGVASGTSLLRNPEVQPQGNIHLNASMNEKYHGMRANFSFLRTASIMRSATLFELSVFTHLCIVMNYDDLHERKNYNFCCCGRCLCYFTLN